VALVARIEMTLNMRRALAMREESASDAAPCQRYEPVESRVGGAGLTFTLRQVRLVRQ
jgi:hypothetical protein